MKNQKIRFLGKGLTAQAFAQKVQNVILYDESDFDTYDKTSNEPTIVSPGIPPYKEMVQQSKNIMSDYDYFANEMPFSIWISGTNGKTTTTQMIQHLLEAKGSVVGGNIGTPVAQLDKDAPIWILETSSFTLHYTNRAKPNLYILLPISEDHISWHGSFSEYELAKLKPLDFMIEGEIAIIPEKYKDYPTAACKITYKSSDDLCEQFFINKEAITFQEPFLLDALLALACQRIIFDELSYEKINQFSIDKHKVEFFQDKFERTWVDDSKATNIDATINALTPYKDKKIYLILGGDDKGADLIPLFEFLKDFDIELFNIGTNTEDLNRLSLEYSIVFQSCKLLENAVDKISEKHDKTTLAVLSPAASSLDQFSSYKARGEQFKLIVSELSLN